MVTLGMCCGYHASIVKLVNSNQLLDKSDFKMILSAVCISLQNPERYCSMFGRGVILASVHLCEIKQHPIRCSNQGLDNLGKFIRPIVSAK